MKEPLVSADRLNPFPGGPFAAPLVASATDFVRATAGWHIAPRLTQTFRMWSPGGTLLTLPTMDLDVEAPIIVATATRSWDSSQFEADPDGLLYGSWPKGRVTVTITHGHVECPQELLPVLAELALAASRDSTITQESILSRSVSYGAAAGRPTSVADVLRRYTL